MPPAPAPASVLHRAGRTCAITSDPRQLPAATPTPAQPRPLLGMTRKLPLGWWWGGKITFKELALPLRYSPSQQRRGRRLKGSCVYLGFFHSKCWGCPGTGESGERVPSACSARIQTARSAPACLVKAPFNTDPPRKSPPRQHREKARSCQTSPRTSTRSQQLPGGGEALLKAWRWDAPSTPTLPRRQRPAQHLRSRSPALEFGPL